MSDTEVALPKSNKLVLDSLSKTHGLGSHYQEYTGEHTDGDICRIFIISIFGNIVTLGIDEREMLAKLNFTTYTFDRPPTIKEVLDYLELDYKNGYLED